MCPLLDRHIDRFTGCWLNRDGSNVQKQLAEEPNTLLSSLDLADTSTALTREATTTGRNDLVDAFIGTRGSSKLSPVKQA